MVLLYNLHFSFYHHCNARPSHLSTFCTNDRHDDDHQVTLSPSTSVSLLSLSREITLEKGMRKSQRKDNSPCFLLPSHQSKSLL